MPPDSISGVRRPAVSWQDFNDVVNSGIVADDAKLDLIEDLYSNTTISHTGVWGRGWRMSESDKARSFEIRSALADAIRFRANVGSGMTTGNATLDAILERIETTKTPLTKREVRQVLNEVGKIVDIMSARRVLTVSIDKARDICRPGGMARKMEGDIVALRQRVLGAKNIQDRDVLLSMINELLAKQDKVFKALVSFCGDADKRLLATAADGEAKYISECATASQDILMKVNDFEMLKGGLRRIREKVGERLEKVALEDQVATLERKINHRKSLSGGDDAFDSTLDKMERTLKSARQQLEEVSRKLASAANELPQVKVKKGVEPKIKEQEKPVEQKKQVEPKKPEVKEEVKKSEKPAEPKKQVEPKVEPPKPEVKEEVKKQEEPKIKEPPKPVEKEVRQKPVEPKNVPPKDNLVKNDLDKFVSNNGCFKEAVLPEFDCVYDYGTEKHAKAFEQHNKDVNRKLREEILPNWKTLTSRLDALRQETMKALGVDPKLDEWFKRWHPEFDWSSDSFIGKVREEKIGGKSVTEVEDAILAACQIKNTGKLYVSGNDDEFREINLVVVVGKMKIKQADNTRYIYIDKKENGSLTNEDVNKAIEAFCEKENLKEEEGFRAWADEQIGGVLDVAENVSSFNVAYQECVKDPDALDNLLDEEVNRLEHFTYKEREEISGLIRKAVIDPIKDAENIWDIKGLAFMRNFTELCKEKKVADADGVKEVVQTIIKAQLDGAFALKPSVLGAGKCLIESGRTVDYGQDTPPDKVIEAAIKRGRGLHQCGGANCFMVSIVNALLGNENGQKILRNCFCKGDGKYHFKDKRGKPVEITDDEVTAWAMACEKRYPGAMGTMSKLERVIWAAWLKVRQESGEIGQDYNLGVNYPGNQCEASEVAFLFGLDEVDEKQGAIKYGVSIPESKLGKWVDVKNHLASGNIAVVHRGTGENGHYEAITGAESKLMAERCFTCCDSAGNEARFGVNDIRGDADRSNPNLRRIILLTLPKDIA